MNKVILFSPVQVDSKTLSLVLRSHRALTGDIECWYCDDNIDDESSKLLSFECGTDPRVSGVTSFYFPEIQASGPSQKDYRQGDTHQWNKTNIGRVAAIKNRVIELFLKTDAEYLFFVDADVVLNPRTIDHLLSLQKPVVSEVFWTQWQKGDIYTPQVWDIHPYAHNSIESITQLKTPGCYEVGGLGACTLIHRSVLEVGVNFSPIPSLQFEGEDRHFCVRASAAGFQLFADTTHPPFHVYRAEQLDEARAWFEGGCSRYYFNELWLHEQWFERLQDRTRQIPKPKTLALCLPGESFSSAYMIHMLDLMTWIRPRMDVRAYNGYASNPSVTRQNLTKLVLASGTPPDYVLWIDDDNILIDVQLEMLIHGLDTHPELSLVAGWCDVAANVYSAPSSKTSVGYFDSRGRCVSFTSEELIKANGLVAIEWTGFPVVLMRGSLLQQLGPEAFRYLQDEVNAPEHGFYGEDISFCKQMRSAGLSAVVDTRVKVPHLKLRDANSGPPALIAVRHSPEPEVSESLQLAGKG